MACPDFCTCHLTTNTSEGLQVTGTGSGADPYVISLVDDPEFIIPFAVDSASLLPSDSITGASAFVIDENLIYVFTTHNDWRPASPQTMFRDLGYMVMHDDGTVAYMPGILFPPGEWRVEAKGNISANIPPDSVAQFFPQLVNPVSGFYWDLVEIQIPTAGAPSTQTFRYGFHIVLEDSFLSDTPIVVGGTTAGADVAGWALENVKMSGIRIVRGATSNYP